MKIYLSPVRADTERTLSVAGDVLIVDGVEYDFSTVPDGGMLECSEVDCDWLVSDVERVDGQLQLTVILPHGKDAPHETRFPEPIVVTEDGPVKLPDFGTKQ